jgi:acetoin utilization deacetylase AcuC-like enzyme
VWVTYSDHFLVPLPEGHRFPMGKYAELRRRLLARGILRPEELHPSVEAPVPALLGAHTEAYVRAICDGSIDARAMRRIGLPWSPALVARSRASTGGTLAAAREALTRGFAGNLAGGTHHAFADHGAGFCVFNDIAVATRALLAEGRVARVLVVDVDVHQGDGTAAILGGDPRVFTLSLHGAKNFPFHKQRSDLDVELPDGTGDAAYLAALRPALLRALDRGRPDLVFVQGGVDALAEDTLGRLALTHGGLRARDEHVLGTMHHLGVPVALTLGGGYARPLEATIDAHVGTYEVARALYGARRPDRPSS